MKLNDQIMTYGFIQANDLSSLVISTLSFAAHSRELPATRNPHMLVRFVVRIQRLQQEHNPALRFSSAMCVV